MSEWVPIRYLGFWDVPRNFLVRHHGELYLFDCPFSEELEDYPDVYSVFILPDRADDEIPADWARLPDLATRSLGNVPISAVRFDSTRRKMIGAEVFDLLAPVGLPAIGDSPHAHASPVPTA